MNIFPLKVTQLFADAGLKRGEVLKCLIVPDKHYPNHCKKTHKATLDFARDYQPHVLGSIGDWWEMAPVSHWESNANFQLLREELGGGMKVLRELSGACGDNLVYEFITLGNHEAWYNKLLSNQAPGLKRFLAQSGMDTHFANVSGLEAEGFECFDYNEGLELGDIIYTHGIYTNVYHARKHVDVVGKTVLYGHTETQQLHTKVDARGVSQGISLGTQRDEKQCSFLGNRPTSWVTSLTFVEYRYDGTSTIYSPKIVNGKFSLGGKIYG